MREYTDELTKLIARFTAQRACLDVAAEAIAEVPGVILELGLGKARTYDRLRYLFPEREIFVFEYEIHCPSRLAPPTENLFLGDVRETLPGARARFSNNVALVHADIGSFDEERDREFFGFLAEQLEPMLVKGAIVLCDREVPNPPWERLAQPPETLDWTYYVYKVV